MHNQKRHPSVSSNPVQFLLPDSNRLLLQYYEKVKVLNQSVRQLHKPTPIGSGYPKWKNGLDAIGLRFERVSVKRGRVVKDVQVLHPAQVVKHEAGTETLRVPLF